MDIAIKKNNYRESGHFNVRVKKYTLFYYIVISALYISGFEQLIKGIVRRYFPECELAAIILIQSYIYLVPLLFCWNGLIDTRFKLALFLFVFLLFFSPTYKYGNIITLTFAIKTHLLCFCYIPILKYLDNKDNKFKNNLLKHFIILASIFAAWSFVELISCKYFPGFNDFMRSFSDKEALRNSPSRALGMHFDFVTGAIMVSFLSVICFLKKNYIWSFILLALSLFLRLKTWAIATVIVLIIVSLRERIINKLFMLIFILCCGLLFYEEIIIIYFHEYFRYFFIGNTSGSVILDLFYKDGWVLFKEGGFFPNGFIRETYSIIDTGLKNIPIEFIRVETALLCLLFQMGFIATCIWLIILYYSFFKNDYLSFSNDYKVLLFLSLFSFVHVLTIVKPFMFIFILFCGIQAENKSNNIQVNRGNI